MKEEETARRKVEALSRATAGIGLTVASGAAISPHRFLSLFGVNRHEVSGAAAFGWRMFAARTLYISVLALRGQRAARDAFLPIQILDQMVFAHALKTRAVPRPGAALAMALSAAIIVLDLLRRAAERPSSS